jgi:predicted O-methyltransferase YrrM
MYSAFTLAKKYFRYYTKASNSKGHGVHSPFVFEFITKVLNDRKKPEVFARIEALRAKLRKDESLLTIEDFGAGSAVTNSTQRTIKSIAHTSLKPARYGRLMHRMINYYMATRIVELGTSLGITTSYLASSNSLTKVYTFEGSNAVADVAEQNFKQLGLYNIQLLRGNFDDTLAPQLDKISTVNFAFVDGNHRKEPTIRYFELLLAKATDHSIFIFDDIHWSEEMEEAWAYIQQHPAVTLTIDLFFIGIVFFRKEQKVAQHFVIRY